jgi:hypothetical protein
MQMNPERPCHPKDDEKYVPTLSPEERHCLSDRHWYAFLCSSLITFFAGLLLVLSWRIVAWTMCQRRPTRTTAVNGSGAQQPGRVPGANGVGAAGLPPSSGSRNQQQQLQAEPPSVVSSTGTSTSISIQPDQSSQQQSTTGPNVSDAGVGEGDGENAAVPPAQIGWLTSAQDWAGGMISGQTTTGRILVSESISMSEY